ncbi:hypothetical protein CEXT_544041 [Caerostris extrusa]|uniref:Uncharacterized protein n=1 Tax=Caerostris extrusa TaxID=172846 RepID=A0AAV4SJG2_CAEEX|nr:hypothetical protein CEXT_544041 [Caerostris extrusa]
MWCLAKLHGMWYLHDGSCLLWYNKFNITGELFPPQLNKKRDLWLALKCVPHDPLHDKRKKLKGRSVYPCRVEGSEFLNYRSWNRRDFCSGKFRPGPPQSTIRSANTKY